MKQKGTAWLVVLIIILLIAVGLVVAWYFVFQQPRNQLEKGRTPDSSLKTEESLINKTEVKESGFNSELVITPSNNDVISGTVTIKANQAPAETKHVGFSISKTVEGLGSSGPTLGFVSRSLVGVLGRGVLGGPPRNRAGSGTPGTAPRTAGVGRGGFDPSAVLPLGPGARS